MKNLKVIATICMVLVAQTVQTNLLAKLVEWPSFWVHITHNFAFNPNTSTVGKVTLTKVVNNSNPQDPVYILNENRSFAGGVQSYSIGYNDQQFKFELGNSTGSTIWADDAKGMKVSFTVDFYGTLFSGGLDRGSCQVTFDYTGPCNYYEINIRQQENGGDYGFQTYIKVIKH